MSFHDGLWHYRGHVYPTLYDVLVTVWPARRCGHG